MDLPLKVSDCSVGMVEELIGGLSDWKNTQDIIRMTFKAISEVLKNQSISISHINKQISSLPEPPSKEEFLTRSELEEIRSSLHEKVSKKDIQSYLSNKVSIDQLNIKLNSDEFYSEMQEISKKIEKINEDFSRRVVDLSNTKDLQKLHMEITEKATWKEVQEELAKKADFSAVSDLVSKKTLRPEIEEIIRFKVDTKDLAGLSSRVDLKCDKSEMESQCNNLLNKIAKISSAIEKLSTEDDYQRIEASIGSLQKSQKTEIENLKKQTTAALNKKVDYSEIETICDSIKEKADLKHLEELQDKISKDFKGVLLDFKKDLKSESKKNNINLENISRINEDITKLRTQMLDMLEDRKKDTIEHAQFLKTSAQQIKNECKDTISGFEEQFSKLKENFSENYLKKSDFFSLKNELKILNEQKLNKEDFSLFTSTSVKELKHEIESLKDKKMPFLKPENLEKPAKLSKPAIQPTQDLTHFHTSIQSIIQDLELLKSEVKANTSFLASQLSSITSAQQSFQSDLTLKPSSKEVLLLIENKANIEDTNRALVEIHKELDSKIDSESLSSSLTTLQSISAALQIGRWQWKSGELKSNSQIPWESQVINTSSEVFLWEKDKTSILVMSTGVFLVTFGLFYKKKCRVQINVNGEVIMDTGGKLNTGRNKVFSEFVMVPARARLSVSALDGGGGMGLLELVKYF